MPKVSIIVPVYNVAQYLRECLDSIVNQTLREIEIICVNDGSTDASLAILEEYAAFDDRIKVISKQNSGYGHTMNVGIDVANGEYIGIVEPDDYVKLDMYEALYLIAKKENLDIVKADFYRFTGSDDNLKLEYNHLSKNGDYYGKVLNPKDNIEIFRFIMNTWSGIYKRAFLNQYHIRHNETPGASFQDNGFWFQSFCRAERIYFVNQPFYMNRRDNPTSSVHDRGKIYCASEEYKYIYHFLEQNPDLKERYIYIYSVKKFHNFNFTMNRIGEEYHMEFLQHFSKEFNEASEKGELKEDYFLPREWKRLQLIMKEPGYYYSRYYKKQTAVKQIFYYWMDFGFVAVLHKVKEKLFG